eukprot:gene47153-63160_t
MSNAYDVIIIGSGPGGYIAAIRAAQLGMKVAVVEREHLAGICSNWGCIPTKALLRTADVMHTATHAKDYGLTLEGSIKPDIKAIVARSRGIAHRMNNGVGFLFKKNKVDWLKGRGRLDGPGRVTVEGPARPPRADIWSRVLRAFRSPCHWRWPHCCANGGAAGSDPW